MQRLFFQRLRRSRGLLDQGGILLRDLVHLRHRNIHLVDPGALLGRRRCDFLHDTGHAGNRILRFLHRRTGTFHQFRTGADLAHRGLYQFADFLGGRGAALSQRTHLAGNHGKTAPLLTRTGRFNRRVQGQNIGLERDAFDHRNNLDHLVRLARDIAHGGHYFTHHIATAIGDLRRGTGQATGLFCIFRGLAHHRGNFRHARRGLLQRGGLLFSALRQIGIAAGNFLGGGRDVIGRDLDLADGTDQGFTHPFHRIDQAVLVA